MLRRAEIGRSMQRMRTVRGEWRRLPGAVEKAATDIARTLHRQVASDDLFLLALAGLDRRPPARQALEAEGVTVERLRERIVTWGDDPAPPPTHLTYAPAYYSMCARAEAFAATLGDGAVTPEHVLLALLWGPTSQSSQILWQMGVSRERLVDRLTDLGVPVPSARLPAQEEIDVGERVWFDRDQIQAVIDHLHLHVPPGTVWGFNYDGDRAWVSSESSVDLPALVADALPPAIELRRLDHVQLAMPAGREDDAVAFYQGLLGLPQVPKPAPLATRGGCWFEKEDLRLHLGVDPDFRPARKAHPALLVRGLAGLADRMRAAGVPTVDGEQIDDERRIYADDPFGNRVELLERGGTLIGPL